MVSTFEFSGHVVGLMVTSNVDQAILDEIHEKIRCRFQEHKKLNLYVEVEAGADIPIDLLIKDLYFKLSNAGEFGKIAVVSDGSGLKKVVKIKDFLMGAEIEAYTHEDRIEAMNWITQ